MTLTHFAIIAVCAYLLGSLSFAIIVSKVTLGKDIRNYGSGNAGLTNAYRTMGAKKRRCSFCSVTLPRGAAAVSGRLGARRSGRQADSGYFCYPRPHVSAVFRL